MNSGKGNYSQTKFNFMRVIPNKFNFHVNIDSDRIIDVNTKRIIFKGDRVFYCDSQSDVRQTLLIDVVDEFFKGCNCLLLAYGGRGCGKSFTCFGVNGDFEDRGLAINLLEQLFRMQALLLHKAEVSLELSFIEFNEKNTTDLLTNKTVILAQHKMTVVSSINAAVLLLLAGCLNRVTRPIKNYHSHCYTSVLTIRMHFRSLIKREPVIKRCQIQIVDLASVEYHTCDVEKRLSSHKQVAGNVSIMNILRAVESLIKQNKFYYISPLICHLRDTLQVHSLIKFIGHSKENLPMLKSICNISKRFSQIPQSMLKYGVEEDNNLRLEGLKEQVKLLAKKSRDNDMFRKQESEVLTNYERVEQIKRLNTTFLNNHISDYKLLSVAQIRPTLTMLKTIINQYEGENSSLLAGINAAQNNEMPALDKLAEKNDRLQSKLSSNSKLLGQEVVTPNQPIILVGQEMRGCGITIGSDKSQILADSFQKTISIQKKIARRKNKIKSDALSNSQFFREQETIQALVKKARSECLDTFRNLKPGPTKVDFLRNRKATTQNDTFTRETLENEFIKQIKLHELNECKKIHPTQRCKHLNFNEKSSHVGVQNNSFEKHNKSYMKVYKAPSVNKVEIFKLKDEFKDQYLFFQKVYLARRRK